MPIVGDSVNVPVLDSGWASPNGSSVNGQIVHVQGAGYFFVSAVIDATTIQLNNEGYTGNRAPGSVILSGSKVSPGGLQGIPGPGGTGSSGYLQSALNLFDVGNVATSRNNLGLGSAALLAAGSVLQKANNLSDVANAGTARTSLGLGTAAIHDATDFLTAASNLTDLGNVVTARANLGLAATPTGYILIRDSRPPSTVGGTFNNGAWQTRNLNNLVIDDTGTATLVANQFTLVAGTYRLRALAPGYKVGLHQIRLYNVTDAGAVAYGSSERTDAASDSSTNSFLSFRFTILSAKTFELQHQCSVTQAVNGFGIPNSFGGGEIYAVVELEKEAN